MIPIALLPKDLESFIDTSYRKYGYKISSLESKKVECMNIDSKNILCFIGGFLDSYYRALYNVFTLSLNSEIYIKKDLQDFKLMYVTYDCFKFLSHFIRNVLESGYRFYIISHSWGAKNILRILLKYNFNIELLITLDCVGHFKIPFRPSNICMWENIYIADFHSYYNRANIAALIGGARQYIKFADINTPLNPPAHHASVIKMLLDSKCISISNLRILES